MLETLIPQTIRQLYKEDKLGDSIYRELTEENPVDKYDNPIDSGRELIVNVTGLRFNPITEVKTENALSFKLRDLDRTHRQYKNELHKLINDAKTDSSISLQDILNKHLEINSLYYRNYVETIQAVEAAKYFDINPLTLKEIIKDNTSFKKENKTDLQFLTNNFHPIIIGEESYNTLLTEVIRSDEDKRAILDTIATNNWKFKQLPILDLENVSEKDMEFFEELMEEEGIVTTARRSFSEKVRERRVTGGFISGPYVPQTKENPADRINPITDEPYQEQMDRLGFAEGEEVFPDYAALGAEYTDDNFIATIIGIESGGNPDAISDKGAKGLMQIMTDTAKDPGFGVKPFQGDNLFDPVENVRLGTDYINALRKKFGNDRDALIAYNYGYGNTLKWIEAGRDKFDLPSETREYLRKAGIE